MIIPQLQVNPSLSSLVSCHLQDIGFTVWRVADGILGSCMSRFGNVPDILSATLYSLLKQRALVWLVYLSHGCWQRLHSTGILFNAAAQLVTNPSQKITTSIFEVIRQGKKTSFKVRHQDAIKHGITFRETVTFIRAVITNDVFCMNFCLSVTLLHEKKISHIKMIQQCVFQLVLFCWDVPEKNFLKIRYNTAYVQSFTVQLMHI